MNHRADRARERAGLSVGQAAKLLNMLPSDLQAIEERATILPDHANRLAELYQVRVEWLTAEVELRDYTAVDGMRGAEEHFTPRPRRRRGVRSLYAKEKAMKTILMMLVLVGCGDDAATSGGPDGSVDGDGNGDGSVDGSAPPDGRTDDSLSPQPMIPGGTFLRSFDNVSFMNNGYPATVSGFTLDKYEATVARFRVFAASTALPTAPLKCSTQSREPGPTLRARTSRCRSTASPGRRRLRSARGTAVDCRRRPSGTTPPQVAASSACIRGRARRRRRRST